MKDDWEEGGSEILVDCPFYRLTRVERRRKGQSTWGSFHIMSPPDWVNIVCQIHSGEFVFVRQMRHGIDDNSLEIPGGCIDPGESPLQAAQRELAEETGFASDRWIDLGFVHPNPAMMSNRCFQFLALDAQRFGPQHLSPYEDIDCATLRWETIQQHITDGTISHALVLCALSAYQRWKDGN